MYMACHKNAYMKNIPFSFLEEYKFADCIFMAQKSTINTVSKLIYFPAL